MKKIVVSAAVAGIMLASAGGVLAFHGHHLFNYAVVNTVTKTGANSGDNLQVGGKNSMTTGSVTAQSTVTTVANTTDAVMPGHTFNDAHVGTTTTTDATSGDNTQVNGSHHHHSNGTNDMTTGAVTATGTVTTLVNTTVSSDNSL